MRPLALVVVAAACVVLAVGCSGSKAPEEAAPGDTTPMITLGFGVTMPSITTTTLSPYATTTTFAPDDEPIDRQPNLPVFCKTMLDAQDLYTTFVVLKFDNPLGLMAAPGQARTVARTLKSTAPDDISDVTNYYADLIDHAGQSVGAATSLNRVAEGAAKVQAALQDPQVAPLVTYYQDNCNQPDFG